MSGACSDLYPGRESNPHFRRNWILNPARLPIPPPGQIGKAKVAIMAKAAKQECNFLAKRLRNMR